MVEKDYYLKYLKYKQKYLKQKNLQIGGEIIKLYLSDKIGNIINIDVENTITIRQLKEIILANKDKLSADFQDKIIDNLILFYKGQKLLDENTVTHLQETKAHNIDIRYRGQKFVVITDINAKTIPFRERLVPFILDDMVIKLNTVIDDMHQSKLNQLLDIYLAGSIHDTGIPKKLTLMSKEDGIYFLGLTYEIPESFIKKSQVIDRPLQSRGNEVSRHMNDNWNTIINVIHYLTRLQNNDNHHHK